MQSLAQRRLSIARGIVKAVLWANGQNTSHYSSSDVNKAAQAILEVDKDRIDEMLARGLGKLWSPNGQKEFNMQLSQCRLIVAKGLIKAELHAQGLKLLYFDSADITNAVKQVIAADPQSIDYIVKWAWQGLELPNGL